MFPLRPSHSFLRSTKERVCALRRAVTTFSRRSEGAFFRRRVTIHRCEYRLRFKRSILTEFNVSAFSICIICTQCVCVCVYCVYVLLSILPNLTTIYQISLGNICRWMVFAPFYLAYLLALPTSNACTLKTLKAMPDTLSLCLLLQKSTLAQNSQRWLLVDITLWSRSVHASCALHTVHP